MFPRLLRPLAVSLLCTASAFAEDGTSVEVLLPGERGAVAKCETTGAGLADYRRRVAEARQRFVVNCPWKTTNEAMRELRAGEQD